MAVALNCRRCITAAPFLTLWLLLTGLCTLLSATDVTTYHNDIYRTGLNNKETVLTLSNVNSTNFGKLMILPVDGVIDAEPLYLSNLTIPGQGSHNVVYTVTENDSVYAFDADDGTQLWHTSALGPGESPSDTHSCGQITPEIGITSTPVISRSLGPNGTIFVVAMSKKSNTYFQRIHALDLTTGTEQKGSPVTVEAKYPGTGDGSSGGYVVFDPYQYAERAGLLLLDHTLFTAWTSHCDERPYTGWVIGYDVRSGKQAVIDVTPNGNEGAIWQAGAGLASDGSNIFFLVGNGTFDTALDGNGFPSKGDYGNAFMKLSTSGGKLAVADYFTMHNTVQESNADEDLGSGGTLLLPPQKDSNKKTHLLAVGAGKDGNIYIVDRTNMGKFNPNNDNAIYQELDGVVSGGLWSMPAYFNQSVYFGPVSNRLLQFKLSNAKLASSPASKSSFSFSYPGTTPSISANGTSNGIVWAIEHSSPDVLHAFAADDLSKELYNTNQAPNSRDHFGNASHFPTPMIVNGKVFVGTTNGLAVFGQLGQ